MISRDENNNTLSEGFPDEDIQIVSSFDDMNLPMLLLKGIYGYGWERPTPIQERVIVPMIEGRDIVAQAQSGKGKTGAFAISSLSIVDCSKRQTQVVILSPTRELASQTFSVVAQIGRDLNDLLVASCVGGTHVRDCVRSLRQGPQIVVGTPGRVRHMCEKGELRTDRLQCIILDEADEMLDRGFREAMVEIFEFCPENVQVCLFSATYTPDVLQIANQACRNPFRILVKKEDVTLSGIKQFYVHCERDHYKLDVLCDLYECLSITQLIIFVNSKRRVEELHAAMTAQDHTCSCIHGGMTTEERNLRMTEFRSGSSRVLISTDLLARGIDVSNVGTVINYDLPHNDFSNYIHRIGRSGRHGKKGLALNFVTDNHRDSTTIRELERYYCTKIGELPADLAAIGA
jgi:translation initiation factor 4A